jgi:predicted nucleic-acid-binding protein
LRITADTNLLVRATIKDEAVQAEAARRLMAAATHIVIPITVFCEFAWVLGAGYRYNRDQISLAINQYLQAGTVVTDRRAVQEGLAFLAQGGDFADGAIAHQGRHLGGVYFASFDNEARGILSRLGFLTVSPLDA